MINLHRPIDRDGAWTAKSKKEYVLDANGERIPLKSSAFKTRKVYTVDRNDPTRVEEWRSAWAGAVNAALERGGHTDRIAQRERRIILSDNGRVHQQTGRTCPPCLLIRIGLNTSLIEVCLERI